MLLARNPGAGTRIGRHDDDNPQGTSKSGGGANKDDINNGPGDPHSAPTRIGAEGDGSSGGRSDSPILVVIETNSEKVNPGGSKPEDVDVPLPEAVIGESKDYDQLKNRGAEVDQDVQKAISDKVPDIPRVTLEDNYKIENAEPHTFDKDSESDLVRPFDDLGIASGGAKYTYQEISSNPKLKTLRLQSITEGMYFSEAGVIVGGARYAKNDVNQGEARVKSSDLIFLQWEKLAGESGNVKDLKGFIGRTIMSRSTLETMQTAQKNSKIPLNQIASFKRSDTEVNKDGFNAMLGTEFAKSINQMLKNHHNALGDKTISEVICYPPTKDKTTGTGDDDFTVMLKFDGPQ